MTSRAYCAKAIAMIGIIIMLASAINAHAIFGF